MDIILRFDRGDNVYNFMVLTTDEMRRVIDYRLSHGTDYKFMYDRGLLERIVGHAATFWAPEGFTAYEDGLRMLVRADGEDREVPLSQVRLEFTDPEPGQPAEDSDATRMVTAVVGCHGGEIIEYGWSGLAGPFDPSALTLRIKTQEHGRKVLLVIDEVLYQGVPAAKAIRADTCPEWLWEPVFFFDDDLDLKP